MLLFCCYIISKLKYIVSIFSYKAENQFCQVYLHAPPFVNECLINKNTSWSVFDLCFFLLLLFIFYLILWFSIFFNVTHGVRKLISHQVWQKLNNICLLPFRQVTKQLQHTFLRYPICLTHKDSLLRRCSVV